MQQKTNMTNVWDMRSVISYKLTDVSEVLTTSIIRVIAAVRT
jgi:hypothetical protein